MRDGGCDDQGQARAARRVLEAGHVFIPKTVVLELSWVLRAVADQPAPKALECLEFADALHLCASAACSEMLTFDDRFVRRAAKVRSGIPVVLPSAEQKPEGVAQGRAVYRSRKKAARSER